ncbi:hypothetical protein EVAR_41138_1 [Eumeta japonica]|uniref:Uncharacterized protein n=1 Tax=Eumeta variegata TaxID=151549 RepID=A0A4C1YDJ2_EUMVA|nr:hypothetical protein EVAR_41138_1 [Eumeta japonica]
MNIKEQKHSGTTVRFAAPPPPPESGPSGVLLPRSHTPPLLPQSRVLSTGIDSAFRDNSSIRYECASTLRENAATDEDTADRTVEALTSLTKVKSNHYFITGFDPSIHNIDVWCEEVDRASETNGWDDNERLSGLDCLRGDARVWLNEWSTNDRTWTNFKRECKTLCP